ncbi:PREDICTED: translation initiation factor IF-2-like [Nicrophorus vespilloides]|uniref:Translation initiation factor IF-2-like n=1 Tax=Nicrophorus vespilloides TaxID=110193 RepID=A0ABM1N412_NICVS|nr:PREDICTED: translation initiation factor IF-2-like [Nicrophorus vespilloides]
MCACMCTVKGSSLRSGIRIRDLAGPKLQEHQETAPPRTNYNSVTTYKSTRLSPAPLQCSVLTPKYNNMLPFRYVAVFALLALAYGQEYEYQTGARPAPSRIQSGFSGAAQPKPTPVPILKQINRHNEDGSYTYGYEGADGSFKIETKLPSGDVKGKYGYIDDTGKVRVVEYGATKYGFEPSGEGITVAPPTLVDETTKDGLIQDEYNQPQPARQRAPAPRPSFDSFQAQAPQYKPAPAPARQVPQANFEFSQPRPAPTRAFAPAPAPRPAPRPVQQSFSFASPAPIEEDNYDAPSPRPLPKITYAQPAPQPRPQYTPQQFAPAPAATQAISRPQYSAPAPAPAAPRPQYSAPRPVASPNRQVGGVLDQLAKDYALPQGGAAALHDISFGYY